MYRFFIYLLGTGLILLCIFALVGLAYSLAIEDYESFREFALTGLLSGFGCVTLSYSSVFARTPVSSRLHDDPTDDPDPLL